MKQRLSSLQPPMCATGRPFAWRCDSDPIWTVQGSVAFPQDRSGPLLLPPTGMGLLGFIHPYCIPIRHIHTLHSHFKAASSQGHSTPVMGSGDVGAPEALHMGMSCPSPVPEPLQSRICGDGSGMVLGGGKA